MMLLDMKTFLALLLGMSHLFPVESMSAATQETSSNITTAEPHKMTKQTSNAPHTESLKPAAALADTTVTPPLTALSEPSAQPEVTSKSSSTTTSSANPAQAPVSTQTLSAPAVSATKSADPTSEAPPVFDPTKSEMATTITDVSSTPQPVSVRRTSTSQLPATAGSSEPSTNGVSTDSLISTTSVPTTDSSTSVPTTDSSTSVPTTDSSTSVPTTDSSTSVSTPNDSTTTVSTANISNATDSTPNVSKATDPSTNGSTTNVPTSIASTTASSTTDGSTSNVPINDSTTTVPTTAVPTTNFTTTNGSTSPGGILIPIRPKRLPNPTTKSTTAPREVSKSPTSTEVQQCSTRGLVKQCLIAVATLAAVATIFMVSTIVLCTKLSARKYKVKQPQPATEMMCISALLPERNYTYTRQRNPVSNGVLVMHHSGADSDEDGGDNLTLSSFLPDNDRYV